MLTLVFSTAGDKAKDNRMAKKRHWNMALWGGFLLVLFGLLSYVPLFTPFPNTRDVPWVNFLCFLGGAWSLGAGLKRAFKQPKEYRGKVFGSIFALLSLVGVALFLLGIFYLGRNLPSSSEAPRFGQKAPDFALSDQNGKLVTLTELLTSSLSPNAPPGTKASSVLLIFYRGYW